MIVPCGIRGRGVTSLARILGRAPDLEEVAAEVARSFAAVFGLGPTDDAVRAMPAAGGRT
jgi:lipoyl(octanoyl) transferase